MRIMLLNAATRLFRTQLMNVPISLMDLIGHDILYIILQESFKFRCLLIRLKIRICACNLWNCVQLFQLWKRISTDTMKTNRSCLRACHIRTVMDRICASGCLTIWMRGKWANHNCLILYSMSRQFWTRSINDLEWWLRMQLRMACSNWSHRGVASIISWHNRSRLMDWTWIVGLWIAYHLGRWNARSLCCGPWWMPIHSNLQSILALICF